MMSELPCSPACERNKDPILGVLRTHLPEHGDLLEVGAGTGQHAVHMAAALTGWTWHPTDMPEHLSGLAARIERAGTANLRPPQPLDIIHDAWPGAVFDAVLTVNTLHIMPAEGTPALMRGAAGALRASGWLLIYGPFRYGERHTAPSNADFDRQLRSQHSAMGIRDADEVVASANQAGFERINDHAMPANNRMLVFRKRA